MEGKRIQGKLFGSGAALLSSAYFEFIGDDGQLRAKEGTFPWLKSGKGKQPTINRLITSFWYIDISIIKIYVYIYMYKVSH